MKIKAIKSFIGVCSMNVGEIRNADDEVAKDLVTAGLAVAVEAEKPVEKAEPKAEKPKKAAAKKPAAKRTTKKTTK